MVLQNSGHILEEYITEKENSPIKKNNLSSLKANKPESVIQNHSKDFCSKSPHSCNYRNLPPACNQMQPPSCNYSKQPLSCKKAQNSSSGGQLDHERKNYQKVSSLYSRNSETTQCAGADSQKSFQWSEFNYLRYPNQYYTYPQLNFCELKELLNESFAIQNNYVFHVWNRDHSSTAECSDAHKTIEAFHKNHPHCGPTQHGTNQYFLLIEHSGDDVRNSSYDWPTTSVDSNHKNKALDSISLSILQLVHLVTLSNSRKTKKLRAT